ncbi:hypothetical protein K435DRAFT_866087, partial [Dendrothele bispora CBS 962.96]
MSPNFITRVTRSSTSSIDRRNAQVITPPPIGRVQVTKTSKSYRSQPQEAAVTVKTKTASSGSSTKKRKPNGQALMPIKARSSIKHRAAEVVSEESGGEEPAPKRIKSSGSGHIKGLRSAIEDRELEEQAEMNGNSSSEDENDMEGEREDDKYAAHFLEDEAPLIVDSGTDDDFVHVHHRRRHSRSSSYNSVTSSRFGPTPPATSDYDDLSEKDELEDDKTSEYFGSKMSTSTTSVVGRTDRQTRKLEYELPQVGTQNLPTSRTTNVVQSLPMLSIPSNTLSVPSVAPPLLQAMPVAPAYSHSLPMTPSSPWLERTNIHVNIRGRTYVTAMSGQCTEMRKVIERAIKLGKRNMITDDTYSPVGPQLKSIAFAALVATAEELGYDGKGDVADHLENGDDTQYIKPLTNYVSHRIGQERKDLKTLASAT